MSSVPYNFWGYQEPQKGNNYYSLVTINNLLKCPGSQNYELQSYAQIKLHQKLRKKKMRGILHVSLIDTAELASSRLGLYFSSNQPLPQYFCPFNTCPYISATPQIQRPYGQAVTNKINWTRVEGIFQGNGEEWMTMGNFYRANQTDTIRVANFPDSITNCGTEGAAYYIDNLSLVEEDRAVAYFDTTKKYLCVQQGTSKVLGDTLVRPWLFYTWRNANGDSVGNTRNYTYNANLLENTFFTVEIKDTGEYAFITKAIDTIYLSSSISGQGCTYVGIDDVMKDAREIDFYYYDNKIIFNALHERFTGSAVRSSGAGSSAVRSSGAETYLRCKTIDGKIIFETTLKRNKNEYSIGQVLPNGFYMVEVMYEGQSIKRKKIICDVGAE
jgi:hypothetical protein